MEKSENYRNVGMHRRTLLKGLAGIGIGTVTFRRALAAQAAQAGAVTPEMIKQAEWIAGLDLTDEERTSAARTITRSLRSFAELRKVEIGYEVPPALTFLPMPPRPAAPIARNQATASREGELRCDRARQRSWLSCRVDRAFKLDRKPADQLDGADEALSRPPQAV